MIAIHEIPIKAGRVGTGKMKVAHFWPVVCEQEKVRFLYSASRAAKHFETAFGLRPPNAVVLHSDDYSAYEHYPKKPVITHAQCGARARKICPRNSGYLIPVDES